MHYQRWYAYGSPHIIHKRGVRHGYENPKNPLWDRMMKYIDVTEGCWLWMAATRNGYSTFSMGGKSRYVHRIMYEKFIDRLVDGMVIDHLCEVRNCVNPFHLEQVTSTENIKRSFDNRHSTRFYCKRGHEWNDDNTRYYGKAEQKRCRKCNVIDVAIAREKRNSLA